MGNHRRKNHELKLHPFIVEYSDTIQNYIYDWDSANNTLEYDKLDIASIEVYKKKRDRDLINFNGDKDKTNYKEYDKPDELAKKIIRNNKAKNSTK